MKTLEELTNMYHADIQAAKDLYQKEVTEAKEKVQKAHIDLLNRYAELGAFKMPRVGEIWVHHSGRKYEVLHFTNTAHPSPKFPVAIVYKGTENGEVWSRDLTEWLTKFSPQQPETTDEVR